jgi:SAM-dependent methyltransferase
MTLSLKRRAFLQVWRLARRGDDRRCPCCGVRVRSFAPYGASRRPNAQCPGCGSLERHRALWLYLREWTEFLGQHVRVLAVAPDASLESQARRQPWDYLSIDVAAGKAARQMDLTALELPDGDRDLLIAYHVLEHIIDDGAAMAEIRRVLRPGGLAMLAVPLGDEESDEQFRDAPPGIRAREYGQPDHVRLYGRLDFGRRLRAAGLEPQEIRVGDVFDQSADEFGLLRNEVFFVARPAAAETIGRAADR